MLPLDVLKTRSLILTHAACADGAAAAMLAAAALPHCEVRAFAYDDPEYLNLPATPGILAVDITPPAGRAAEFVAVGTVATVIAVYAVASVATCAMASTKWTSSTARMFSARVMVVGSVVAEALDGRKAVEVGAA